MYRKIQWCLAGLASVTIAALAAGPASAAPAPAAADRTTVTQMPAPKPPPGPAARTAGYFVDCPQSVNYCAYDSGWEHYYRGGGCWARTELGWWRDTGFVSVRVHVSSPYPFGGCWVNSTPQFGTTLGAVLNGKSYYAMACATLDPTCSSYQARTYYEDSGLHPLFRPYVNAISAQHASP
jgi:hypothetical protein